MLTEEQKTTVRQWVQAGSSLSEIQTRIRDELGVPMTYMDVRLLVLDLGVSVKDKPTEKVKATEPAPAQLADEEEPEEVLPDDFPPAGPATGVAVDIDRVMQPGSIVSGSVTFSDGVTAKWALDQFGRLALDAGRPGYKPSPEDVQAFQQALHQQLKRRGF